MADPRRRSQPLRVEEGLQNLLLEVVRSYWQSPLPLLFAPLFVVFWLVEIVEMLS
jgi:hypothetical protein